MYFAARVQQRLCRMKITLHHKIRQRNVGRGPCCWILNMLVVNWSAVVICTVVTLFCQSPFCQCSYKNPNTHINTKINTKLRLCRQRELISHSVTVLVVFSGHYLRSVLSFSSHRPPPYVFPANKSCCFFFFNKIKISLKSSHLSYKCTGIRHLMSILRCSGIFIYFPKAIKFADLSHQAAVHISVWVFFCVVLFLKCERVRKL